MPELHSLQEEGRKEDRKQEVMFLSFEEKNALKTFLRHCVCVLFWLLSSSCSTNFSHRCTSELAYGLFRLRGIYIPHETETAMHCRCVLTSDSLLPCLAAPAFWASSSLAFLASSSSASLASCTSFSAFHSFLLFSRRSSMGVISTWKRLNSWGAGEEDESTQIKSH